MHRIVGRATLALAFAGSVTSGCKRAPAPAVDSGVSDGSAAEDPSNHVLAHVGRRTITAGEYAAALQHMDQFDRIRYEAPERRRELLSEMIDVMLLADEARDKGYDKDPITQQEIREILRDAMLKKAHEGAPAPNEVPENEVREYYEAHKADFRDPERRRVSAIALATEAAAAAVLDAAVRATAAQWGELVRTKSTDVQARAAVPPELAGDLGFVSPPGDIRGTNARVPEEVRAAVFELAKVGDVCTRVVKAGGKFYIVRLAAKTDPHERTLEEAQRAIRVKLAQDAMRVREQAMLDVLRKEFPVQVDEAALAQVHAEESERDAGGHEPSGR